MPSCGNTASNTAIAAPDTAAVRRGLSRDDLFVCVHEHFMTATARYADILLPASMFLELDDIYMGWGHTSLTIGPRVLERHGECRSNFEVVNDLARRLGANHPSFQMDAAELVDATLQASGKGTLADAAARGWIDCAPTFEDAHFLSGFPQPEGRFRFEALADEPVARVGNQRRAGVGDQRHGFATFQAFDDRRRPLGGVVFMIGEGRRLDPVDGQQLGGDPGVLAGDDVGAGEHVQRPGAEVGGVADGRGDDDQAARSRRFTLPAWAVSVGAGVRKTAARTR